MRVVDAHVHIWGSREWMPEITWSSWVRVWGRHRLLPHQRDQAYVEEHVFPGFWDPDGHKLVQEMSLAGIDASVIMPMDFGLACGEAGISIEDKNKRCGDIAALHAGRVYTCVGVDPRRPNAVDLFRRGVAEWRARGLKLYPPTGFYADDPICFPLYEAALELGKPVAFHTGAVAYPLKSKFGDPIYIDAVAARYPDLPIMLLHTGFGDCWTSEAIQVAIYKPNVYCELAGWQDRDLSVEDLVRTLVFMRDRMGAERIVFASDRTAPGARKRLTQAEWVAIFLELPTVAKRLGLSLSESEVALMVGGNADRLFKIGSDPSV
jgi:predicted TIM-barrel fold metal-dependent hydrolase